MTYVSYWEFDRAIEVCSRLSQDDPGFSRAHNCLAIAYVGKHMYPQAIAKMKDFSRLSGDESDTLYADAMEQGFREVGWNGALANTAQVLTQKRKSSYWPPTEIARLYALKGDRENAFRWLNIALQEHDEGLILTIKTDFSFDSLRADPRYSDLLRKTGLPQ